MNILVHVPGGPAAGMVIKQLHESEVHPLAGFGLGRHQWMTVAFGEVTVEQAGRVRVCMNNHDAMRPKGGITWDVLRLRRLAPAGH